MTIKCEKYKEKDGQDWVKIIFHNLHVYRLHKEDARRWAREFLDYVNGDWKQCLEELG